MTDIIIKMAASSATLTDDTLLTSAAETTQNGPRKWERPWSVHEIHAEAGNWSLAGDSGLLQHLQEFSQRVISRTHQIGKDVDDLVHEAKLMDVRVGNVINDFIMLANTQFVENRVYDEDVSQEPSSKEEQKVEQVKTKEQREAELIPRVSLALRLGVNVIENSFVKLDPRVVDSDSEEEDNAYVSEPILEAKDPYASRPLPFLIGTPQFMEDDNIGLLDESSDEEEGIDQGSISVSEDDKEGDESDSEYSASEESEEEERRKVTHRKHRAQTKTSAMSESSDADSGQDIFSDKRSGSQKSDGGDSGDISDSEEEDDDVREKPPALPRGPKDFNAELAARLGTAAPKQAADRQEGDDQRKDKPADYRSQDSLSSGVHQNVGNKGKKNRDSMEVNTDKGTDKKKHSKNTVEDDGLFAQDNGQDDDDIFSKDKGLFSSSKGLFDDDDDDENVDKEGGLVADVKKPPPKVQKSDQKSGSLFSGGITNEEIEDSKMPDDRPRTKSGKLVPTGAVSIFGTGEDLAPVSKLESSGTHIIKKPTAQPAVTPNKSAGGKATSGGRGGLFDDSEEEEDDLFSGAPKKVETDRKASSSASKVTATAAKKSDLFADAEEEDDDDLFGSMAAATSKKKAAGNVGITVESYDEGERVKEKRLEDEQLRKQATPEKKLPPGAVSMFGKSPNPLVAALRNQQQPVSSEEEDNDLSEEGRNSLTSSIHSTSSTTLPPAQKPGEGARNMDSSSSRTSSIFTDDRAEDDLFSIKPKPDSKSVTDSQGSRKAPELDYKTPSKVRSVKDSLFDSSADDEDVDIFSSVTKPTASTKADQGVSLFGDTETIGTAKTGTAAASRLASQSANRKAGSSLFDDSQVQEAAQPLFPGKLAESAGGKDTPKNKTQGLFAHDDLLFGTRADEDPFVDLFNAPVTEQSHKKETQKLTSSQTPASASRPATASLFDGGDDGDDDDDSGLFSVTPVTKPAAVAAPPSPVAAPMRKTISGVTETESTDAVEVKVKEKAEVKEIKKPAGAVSMFGGIDPASVLAKRPTHHPHEDQVSKDVHRDDREMKKDEKVSRTEEKTTVKTPVLKPKPATDLFGGGHGDDDDDDDLFSPKATVKPPVPGDVLGESTHVSTTEGAATPKAEPIKPRKPAGAVPMFGGVDPLAFLKKETVAEVKDETTDEGHDKGKPAPPRPAPKPKVMPREKQDENLKTKSQNGAAAADLFGGDGDDSDDLFGVGKQKTPPPQVAPKSKVVASHSSVAASVGSPKSEREPQSPTVVRPKALAGAVPMFRGIDPFAGMKKKSVSSEPEEESTSQKEKPPTFVDPLAVLTPSVPSAAALKHPASPVIVAKRSVDMTAAINSTYLLPDETRSDQDTDLEKSGSLDFEESTETEMLTSTSKDRPKLSRRRPQSRKARVLAAAQTGINFGDGTPATLPDPAGLKIPDTADKPRPGTVESSNGAIPGPVLENHGSGSKKFTSNPKSADLFGNDDLLDGLTVSADQPLAVNARKTVSDEIFGKDLFHGSSKISNGAAEDLFSDFSQQKDIPPARSEIIAEKTTANEKDQIDGLFSKPLGKTKTDPLSAFLDNNGDLYPTSPQTTRPKAKVDEDIDDLFTSSAKSSTRKSNLASEILRGDDLFSAPKSTPSLSRGASVADSKSADIFEDMNDVFGAPSLGRHKDTSSTNREKDGLTGTRKLQDSKIARPKQPVTKEAKLLADDTDIFSNVPKPTPREPKKKSSKKVVEKNVFRDDIDDIFANTTAATIKPKKEVRKKVSKPAAVISDNIFDDPLS